MNKRINFTLNDISRFREELFGLAIISVIVFHYFERIYRACLLGQIDNGFLKILASFVIGSVGSVGVDIFIFLSGFGIYYSLAKSSDYLSFYHRRVKRVVIPYLVVGCVYWLINDIFLKNESVTCFLYHYSLLSFWVEGNRTFWYIAFICLLYIISPIVYYFDSKGMVGSIIIWVLFCIGVYVADPLVFSKIEIAICRGPLFFFGMYCAYLTNRKKFIFDAKTALLVFGLSIPIKIITTLKGFALRRFFNGFYALFLIIFFIIIRKLMKTNSFFSYILIFAGKYSLELYITHTAFGNLMANLGFTSYNPLNFGIVIILSVFTSKILYRLQELK